MARGAAAVEGTGARSGEAASERRASGESGSVVRCGYRRLLLVEVVRWPSGEVARVRRRARVGALSVIRPVRSLVAASLCSRVRRRRRRPGRRSCVSGVRAGGVLASSRRWLGTPYVESLPSDRKGIGLIFPNLVAEIGSSDSSAATQPYSETLASIPGRVLFSLLGADSLEMACPEIGTLHP